jgi:LemA protein
MLGLKQLFALAEGYPELQADQHFLNLQRQLALTEDRIAAARRFYNGNARTLNVLRKSIPTSVIGWALEVEPASFFELTSDAERVVPRLGIGD